MYRVNVAVLDCCGLPESFTVIATEVNVPYVVGVPLIAPVPELIDNPVGKPLSDQE